MVLKIFENLIIMDDKLPAKTTNIMPLENLTSIRYLSITYTSLCIGYKYVLLNNHTPSYVLAALECFPLEEWQVRQNHFFLGLLFICRHDIRNHLIEHTGFSNLVTPCMSHHHHLHLDHHYDHQL